MNIVIFSRYLFIKHGGGEVNDVNLSIQLARMGHNVVVVAQSSVGQYEKLKRRLDFNNVTLLEIRSVYLYPISWKVHPFFGKIIRHLDEMIFMLLATIGSSRFYHYDAVLVTGRPIYWRLKWFYSSKLIYSNRGIQSYFYKREFNKWSHVIYWGHSKGDLKFDAGINNEISLAPGINKSYFMDIFNSKSIRNDNIISILFVGRIEPIKNLQFLLSAILILSEDFNLKLDIIGTGSQESKCKEYVKNHNLSKVVFFHGAIENDMIGEFYSSSNLFILTSKAENYPIVLLEALASGVPVVAPNIGRVSSIIKSGFNGYIYKEGDMNSFIEFFNKAVLLKKVNNQNLEINDWEDVAQKIERFIEK
jgi:glycosyltransferase involved in cell wall biosynthesis